MMAPDPPLSVGEVKNKNQLATGVLKVGGGWRESIDNHRTMMAGNEEGRECAVDVEGSKEGKGGKGDGE
jgi:hypothetical protein